MQNEHRGGLEGESLGKNSDRLFRNAKTCLDALPIMSDFCYVDSLLISIWVTMVGLRTGRGTFSPPLPNLSHIVVLFTALSSST
jgi:hypothetical protein